jgi:site-specific DNA-methyltransferase (adenine-specific)
MMRVMEYRLEDLLRGLKKFPNQSFNMVYADPPFYHTTMTTKTMRGDIPSISYWPWTKEWLKLAADKAKWGAHIYISFTIGYLWELMRTVQEINREAATFNFLNWNGCIIWEYTNVGTPKVLGKVRRMSEHSYWYNYEVLVYLSKGTANALNRCENPDSRSSIWHIAVPQKTWKKETKVHPTQKPEELFRRILEFSTHRGDLVLDCFSGSGTLLRVAEKLGRHSIGFDIEPRWKEEHERLVREQGLRMKLEAYP